MGINDFRTCSKQEAFDAIIEMINKFCESKPDSIVIDEGSMLEVMLRANRQLKEKPVTVLNNGPVKKTGKGKTKRW